MIHQRLHIAVNSCDIALNTADHTTVVTVVLFIVFHKIVAPAQIHRLLLDMAFSEEDPLISDPDSTGVYVGIENGLFFPFFDGMRGGKGFALKIAVLALPDGVRIV